jgi:hypothetical protein
MGNYPSSDIQNSYTPAREQKNVLNGCKLGQDLVGLTFQIQYSRNIYELLGYIRAKAGYPGSLDTHSHP